MATGCGLISDILPVRINETYRGWAFQYNAHWQRLLLRKGLTKCVDRADTGEKFSWGVGNFNIGLYGQLGGSK